MRVPEEGELSSEYRIFETRQFQKDLEVLAKSGRSSVVEKLHRVVYPQIKNHPHFGTNIRQLKGYSPQTWRYRIGAWRSFYEIDEEESIVFMIAASHRGSAY